MAKADDLRRLIDEIVTASQCASGGDYAQVRDRAAATLAGLLKREPKATAPKAKAKRGR